VCGSDEPSYGNPVVSCDGESCQGFAFFCQ
jgi:hypothetical protein